MKPYPLQWPETLPRTASPKASQFRTTLSAALKNVRGSLEAFGKDSNKPVTNIVLSSNVGGGLEPKPVKDGGVAAWFEWDGETRCVAVDRYLKVEENLQAIHHVLEARRTELRHGGLNIARQTFRGFTPLPAPAGKRDWKTVLGISDMPNANIAKATIDNAYRHCAATAHPDKPGGSNEAMAELNAARDEGYRAIGAA